MIQDGYTCRWLNKHIRIQIYYPLFKLNKNELFFKCVFTFRIHSDKKYKCFAIGFGIIGFGFDWSAEAKGDCKCKICTRM